ncbi:hypothetical protein D3C71_2145880 [compost metagenome]
MVVLLPGPPPVTASMIPKVLTVEMKPVIISRSVVGLTRGRIIRRMVCHGLAPSILAASRSSEGISCSAAK